MKIAIADTDGEALQQAHDELSKLLPHNKDVISVVTNVADFEDVQKLQKQVSDKLGAVRDAVVVLPCCCVCTSCSFSLL